MELYCHKCVETMPTASFELQKCDCPITSYDYYATLSMHNCPCGDYTCDSCIRIMYSRYKVESDMVTIRCQKCGTEEQSCCNGGYYYTQNKM